MAERTAESVQPHTHACVEKHDGDAYCGRKRFGHTQFFEKQCKQPVDERNMLAGYGKDMCNAAISETIHRSGLDIFRVACEHSVAYGRGIPAEIFKEELANGRIYAAEEGKAVFGRERTLRIGRIADILQHSFGACNSVCKRLRHIHCARKSYSITDFAILAVIFIEIYYHIAFGALAVGNNGVYFDIFSALCKGLFVYDAAHSALGAVCDRSLSKGLKFCGYTHGAV